MTDNITIALIISTPPTLMALLAWWESRKLHKTVNSKMDKLLKATKAESFAEGREEGRSETK